MPRRFIVPIAVILFGVGVLYWDQSRQDTPIVSGFVEADEIRVGSRVGGRVKEVLVEEGQELEAGELLLRLEPYDLEELLAQAQSELAAATAQQERLKAGFRPEEIATAEANRDRAKAALDQAIAGPRKQEIQEAADSLRLSEATLQLAQSTYARIESLYGTNSASREEYDQATKELEVAKAAADVERSRLEMLQEGTRQEEIAQVRAAFHAAQAELELRQNGYRKEEIAEAEARVAAARANVEAIKTRINELEVRAPCDCVVEAVDLQPGDLIAAGAPVISLMDKSRLWIRAYVPENRLGQARRDAKLEVKMDSYPDKTFTGRVTFISQQAEFTPSNVQTPEERSKQVFRIKVEIDEDRDLLRPGMAGDIYLDQTVEP